MSKLFKLNIVIPGNKNIQEDVVSLLTTTTNGKIEFLSNHANAIISMMPTITEFVTADGKKKHLFTSSGVGYFKDNTLKIVCDSYNWPEEIEQTRAEEAMKRAKERLSSNDYVDKERASRALARAIARIELKKYL